MKAKLPKLYGQALLNNIFRHPYTGIEHVQKDPSLTRQKLVSRYLEQLVKHGFVQKHRAGASNSCINVDLVRLFLEVAGDGAAPHPYAGQAGHSTQQGNP